MQIKKKTEKIWEYKVGNNTDIDKFVCSWKIRIAGQASIFHRNVCEFVYHVDIQMNLKGTY